MIQASQELRTSVEAKLRANGYYKHTVAQRQDRIRKAFKRLDKVMAGFTPKRSVLDYLGR